MAEILSKPVPLSLGRRVICDLVDAAMAIPLIPIQKPMNIAAIADARRRANPKPSWCSIFTKAYAKVAAERPDLRRAFLGFPWDRLVEYESVTADIAADAVVHGENMPVIIHLVQPERKALAEIDQIVTRCKEDPVAQLGRLRQTLRVARLPRYVRRWVWWSLLNVSARLRGKNVGSFGVSSMANWGVDSLRPIAPCTTLVHYGVVEPDGSVMMRMTFDHRVLDGFGASQALNAMERVLMSEILPELAAMRLPAAA